MNTWDFKPTATCAEDACVLPRARAWTRRDVVATLAGALTAPAAGMRAFGAARNDCDVIVIGAGLAGLHAAAQLESAGLSVLVLEADERVGGRARTAAQAPGKPELGGSEIGHHYARVLDEIATLGLATARLEGADRAPMLNVGGELIRAADWPSHPRNRLEGRARELLPRAIDAAFVPVSNAIEPLDAWLAARRYDPDPSLESVYRKAGANDMALSFLALGAKADRLRDESWLWTERDENSNRWARSLPTRTSGFGQVVGGIGALADAMAARLARDALRLRTVVRGIRAHAEHVLVEADRSYRARFALCTMPLTLLRRVSIEPRLPPLQAQAVREIPYGHGTSVFFEILQPYWERDGGGRALWTDGPAGRLLHRRGPHGEYLWSWLTGPVNRPLRAAPQRRVIAHVTEQLVRARPALRGAIRPVAVMNWSAHPWSRGTTAYRGPGQIARFGNVCAEPHGRIHFAGEHTAVLQQGLEGAMESGERAALEILMKA